MADDSISFVIVGASGDLARRKVIPALFALYCQGLLPENIRIVGFARSAYTDAQFRTLVSEYLECRYRTEHSSSARSYAFLEKCFYCQGQYDAGASFVELQKFLCRLENGIPASRLYYMAIPPSVFGDVAKSLAAAGMITGKDDPNWSRVVIEKPFGYDRGSSDILVKETRRAFDESQIFRIDHYLGKEVVQNLFVLRFANIVFEPVWNNKYIKCVQITWKEPGGIGARAGYFDEAGIIRDVMQNHLLQIMAMVAVEPQEKFDGVSFRRRKHELLRSVNPVALEDLALGQYTGGGRAGARVPGYREEPGVKPGSLTPTYAAAVLRVNNKRWEGVPFLIRAGKGLDEHVTEIRIVFRHVEAGPFLPYLKNFAPNELVVRVQPDEEIYLSMINKVPGLEDKLASNKLDLKYATTFAKPIPDAYECLLLDVLHGEQGLFIGAPELEAAWDIFTPVLREMASSAIEPDPYPCFSRGPDSALRLVERHGLKWIDQGTQPGIAGTIKDSGYAG